MIARALRIAPVALAVAGADWLLKASAVESLRPDQLVFNTDRPWHLGVVALVLGALLLAVAVTRLLEIGAAVIIGGGLGNMGELALFGQVTDFVPLGIPYRGAVWSPGDFFLAAGLVLLWVGAARYGRTYTHRPRCTTSA